MEWLGFWKDNQKLDGVLSQWYGKCLNMVLNSLFLHKFAVCENQYKNIEVIWYEDDLTLVSFSFVSILWISYLITRSDWMFELILYNIWLIDLFVCDNANMV